MNKIIIDIFMYVFEALIFYYYSNSLFKKKHNFIITLSSIMIGNAFLFATYQLGSTYVNGICLFFTFFILLLFLFDISFKSAIFHSLIFLTVMIASETVVILISSLLFGDFNTFENDITAYIFVILTSKLTYFIIIMIILKVFAVKEHDEINDKYFWLLFIGPFTNILMFVAFRYITYQVKITPKAYLFLIISSIGSLFANILIFAIYEISQKNTKELYNLKTIQKQEEQDIKYFKIIEQSNKDMRVFAHDIKNHLIQIRNMETKEECDTYIDKLLPNIEKFTYTGISKNKMLDLIINKYMTLCDNKRIQFNIDVKTANLNYIDDLDLSTLLNNLLDNAIEAAEKSDNGYINVNIFSKNELYDGLIIKNSCIVSPIIEKSKLITTKENKSLHGLGSSSINKVIKKYNAVYDWKYDQSQNIFETDIAFSKK